MDPSRDFDQDLIAFICEHTGFQREVVMAVLEVQDHFIDRHMALLDQLWGGEDVA